MSRAGEQHPSSRAGSSAGRGRDRSAALPAGTVTFLFTDIEGSTALWERHPEGMRPALDRHNALVRAAIEGRGGFVFKTVGDGFYAVFSIAPDALVAALDAQRALRTAAWGEVGPLRVRMALQTGTAEPRDGDYHGRPLNRVARLLATASGGQILLALSTAELVRDSLPAGVDLRDLGEHRFRDVSRAVRVFQVVGPDLQAEPELSRTAENPADHEAAPAASGPLARAYLLGDFRIVLRDRTLLADAWERPKARQLLKCLLTRPRHRLTKDEAIELFWPESDPDRADQSLRSTVSSIRRTFRVTTGEAGDGEMILSDQGIIRFRSETDI